jgi:hypothetical protein
MENINRPNTPGRVNPTPPRESPLVAEPGTAKRSWGGIVLIVLLCLGGLGVVGYYLIIGFGSRAVDRVAERDIGDIVQGRYDTIYQKLKLAPEDRAVTTRILQAAVLEGSCRFSAVERQRTAGGVVIGSEASISGTLTCGHQSLFVILKYAGKGTVTSPLKLYEVSIEDIKNAEGKADGAQLLNVYTRYHRQSAPSERPLQYATKSIAEADRILLDGTIGDSCRQAESAKVNLTLLANAHVDSWRTVTCATVKKPVGAV